MTAVQWWAVAVYAAIPGVPVAIGAVSWWRRRRARPATLDETLRRHIADDDAVDQAWRDVEQVLGGRAVAEVDDTRREAELAWLRAAMPDLARRSRTWTR